MEFFEKLKLTLLPKKKFELFSPRHGQEIRIKGKSTTFKKDLIKNLQDVHKILFGLYGEIQKAIRFEKPDRILTAIENFNLQLQHHLLEENSHLYIYMKDFYKSDKELEVIKDMQTSILPIISNFTNSMSQYSHESLQRVEVRKRLKRELEAVAKYLLFRTSKEESFLYPMYIYKK